MIDYPIMDGIGSKKEAERLKEVLALRLRQTIGVNSIQDARACLILSVGGIPEKNSFWHQIDLNPSRPVEILDLSKKEMGEFLRGVIKGEKLAKKAAQETLIGSIKHPGLVKMARSKSPWTPDKKKRK